MHKKSILSIREKERNLPCISLLQYIIAPFGTYAPKKGETSGRGFCPNCFEVHQKFFFYSQTNYILKMVLQVL